MLKITNLADKAAVEAEKPITERWSARTLYEQLCETAEKFPDRPAISFQLKSGPADRSATLKWSEFRAEVTRAANMLRRLGVGPKDAVAYILPNGIEAPVALLAGATAGIVNPINPMLNPETIAGILRDADVKVVITLAPFPKTDVAQKVAEALEHAPSVRHLIEVDLKSYLGFPLSLVVPFMRPRIAVRHKAEIHDWQAATRRETTERLDFEEEGDDRVCAYFHTGGTTGLPKIAQHRASGILYNGWCGTSYMFTEKDVLICPLPMFHVLAAYPVFMSCLVSGAHMVMVTPQGYRGEGVFRNFWKLVERWRVTFMIMVPTAATRLMQVKVDADVSTLHFAISGSAAMPRELFERFEQATGVTILEGYGMTESTCLISINPPHGERKIGSVGLPFPYSDVRILHCDASGAILRECDVDEVGEICVSSPGVSTETYTDPRKNVGSVTPDGYLRTGDLGRVDSDGYIWITGRAKDLIIRGGHNIDPALIEEALMTHPDVAFAGAIGQPDRHAGEVPAAFVELVEGASVTAEQLLKHVRERISEHAAIPKQVEVMDELPKTAVGKIFKPDLRRLSVKRIYDAALEKAGVPARVTRVVEDKRLGLVAEVSPLDGAARDDDAVVHVLGAFLTPWRWAAEESAP
jgi:acyl-CoA synthetase (AMP-forming)/AMP-acid ligase II